MQALQEFQRWTRVPPRDDQDEADWDRFLGSLSL
jgi:hypothetical protein